MNNKKYYAIKSAHCVGYYDSFQAMKRVLSLHDNKLKYEICFTEEEAQNVSRNYYNCKNPFVVYKGPVSRNCVYYEWAIKAITKEGVTRTDKVSIKLLPGRKIKIVML